MSRSFPSHDRVIEHPGCASTRGHLRPLFLFLLLASLQPLGAQDKLLPVFHFQKVNGLSTEGIRARVIRDNEGFVWIGTLNGLERFDGYSVKDYRNIPDDPHSLSSNYVPALLVDTKKRLWVGTYDTGLSLYDRATDRFFNLLPRPGDSSWYEAKTIARILEDHNGNLWLASRYQGVVRLALPSAAGAENPDTLLSHIRFTTFPLGTPHNSAADLFERADGKILVASDCGLLILDPSTHSTSRLNIATPPGRQLDSASIQCFSQDSSDLLWVGTETEGLFRIDGTHRVVQNYRHLKGETFSVGSDNIQDITVARRGNLWIGTDAGIQLFSPETGQSIPYLTVGPAPRGPSYMTMLSVDGTGTLWIATAHAGVHWLSPRSELFPHFGLRSPNGTPPRGFDTIERDRNGNLWFTSGEYISQIDITSGIVLKVIDAFRGGKPLFGDRASFIDKNGIFWYGTWGLGLLRVDLASGQVRNYGTESDLGKSRIANSIARGSGDSLWIAAHYDGLKKFDPVTGKFTVVPGFSKGEVWTVMRDHRGMVWVISAISGISILDPATGTIEALRHYPSDPHSLSSNHGRNVYEDPAGRYWIGAGNMINLYDPTTRAVTRYPNPAFDKALFAHPLQSDTKGRLWVHFLGGGLSMLDPSTGTYTNFDNSDGVCGDVLVGGGLTLEDGRIVLGGVDGLNVFHPDSVVRHRPAPPLVLTRMSINDNPVTPPLLADVSSSLELPFSQNVLEFEFAAIDIDAPGLVQYQYRLEGLEQAWEKPKERRFVRYIDLAPGAYMFKVRATSTRGEWPDQEITLAISISPPWWRTWWAYGGYGLIFLFMLFGSYHLRLKQLRLKQLAEMEHFQAEHLAHVDRLKSRFFSNISHEFRTPLTLILGPAEQAIETTQEASTRQKLRLIKANANNLFGLVNQLLDFSRLESGMMRLQVSKSDIVQFLRRVVLSFESWAERKRIGLEFRPDAESVGGFFDADKLEKIVNNLMSNALKFTPESGAVKVGVSTRGRLQSDSPSNGLLAITVSDTGIGIPEEKIPHIFDRFYRVDETHTTEGTGIGLALTKELVDLHHGTIAVESTPGEGSVFTVRIPIQQSAYAPEETVESGPQVERPEYTDPEASVEKPEPAAPAPPAEGKPIVLIVEDNADLRAYIREYLEAEYAVQEAENGKTGYDRAVEFVPDIVISDVMMPEMDGIELCRALKQDVRTSHVPVILLTARAGTDSKIEGLEIGADDYVTKPFDSKEVVARVRNLIEQRRQLRKKFSTGFVLKPGEVAVSSLDDAFLQKAISIVEKRMSDEKFTVEELAVEMGMSRVQVHRKLTALTNLSASEFIRYMRLHRGMELLRKNTGTVSEIAYMVGFGKPSTFAKWFQEQFGVLPSSVPKDVSGKTTDRNT